MALLSYTIEFKKGRIGPTWTVFWPPRKGIEQAQETRRIFDYSLYKTTRQKMLSAFYHLLVQSKSPILI